MAKFDDFIRRKKAEHGSKFDPSALAPEFIPFYNNGVRIRVQTMGMIKTGTVGVTTGWKPVFLLMQRRTSISSWITLSKKDKILEWDASDPDRKRRIWIPYRG